MAVSTTQQSSRININNLAFTLVTFGVAAVLAMLLYGVIEGAPTQITLRPYWDMWSLVAVITFVGWSLISFVLPIAEERKFYLVLAGLSIFMVAIVALALKDTLYTLDAIEADQRFYTAFVTKLAAQWGYGDVVYEGLPAFYPPLYFWLLARLANIAAIEPYMSMKIGVLLTAFLMPYGVAWLWGRSVAYPIAVGSAFAMLFYQEWFKTAEWLSLVLFVPWWIYWVENSAKRTFTTRRKHLLWWAVGGFIGSLIFQTYYYWFFIGGISLIFQLVWDWLNPDSTHRLDLKNSVAILTSTALFSIVYWGPYLVSMAVTGGWQPLQNRWLSEGKIPLPFPYLDGSLEGAFLMAGLLYLLLTAGQNKVSRGMLALVVGVYGWSGLGVLGMLTDSPLLTFRSYTVVEQVLAVAAIMGLMQLWQRKNRTISLSQSTEKNIFERFQRVAPALALLLLFFFSQETMLRFLQDVMVTTARDATYPQEFVDTFESLTDGAHEDEVFLLGYGYRDLLAYRPIYTFLPWSAHFSHPAGLYRERVTFLEKLAATTDPDLFAAALMNNRYSRIDHLLLEREDTTWQFRFADDDFPNRTVERAFAFDEELFTTPYFEIKESRGMTLITPKFEADPLATIDLNVLETEPLDTVALLYTLVSTFGAHVDLPNYEATQAQAEQVLLAADLSTLSPETLLSLQLAAGGALHDKASIALEATLPNFVDVNLVDEQGVERVRVIGYALQPQSAGDSDLELAIYMEAINPMEIDYTMWVHADREGSQLNFDHTLNAPTSTWDGGKIYRDTYVITAEPGAYHFTFGLWRSEGELRLRRTDGAIEVDLGTLTLP
jgi:galactan 5-O-arabinofuranosyltransferase